MRATLECGQVFHWTETEGAVWEGLIGDRLAAVRGEGGPLQVVRGDGPLVARYFGMDHDLAEVYAGFPQDETMLEALDFCRGLRILRQPAWECLATFITSSMKQVVHIRQMSFALRERFGRALPGSAWRAYPEASRLAAASED